MPTAVTSLTVSKGLVQSGTSATVLNQAEADALYAPIGATGTVTSVALAMPSLFSISGSPVTSAGTLTGTLATQAVNTVFAGPEYGSAAVPTFRALGTADIPAVIDATKLTTATPAFGWSAPCNLSFTTSTASNALTIELRGAGGGALSTLQPILFAFRSEELYTASPVIRKLTSALSLVISAGSTLGVTSGEPHRFWLVVFDDAGVLRLGVINCANLSATAPRIYPLREDRVASSTAEGGAGGADSAGVFYTGTAVSAKAYKIVGYLEWIAGQNPTAGTYVDVPTVRQVFGPGVPAPGQPVQVASMTTSTGFATTSSTAQTTTLTQSITPTSAANLMRIDHSGSFENGGINKVGYLKVFRDSTGIGPVQGAYVAQTLTVIPAGQSGILDSPKTTSAVTYAVKLTSADNTTNMAYPSATLGAAPYGSMTLTEIMG